MLNTDARAAAWITWIDALDGDTRCRPKDLLVLTAYRTKLASAPTTEKEDLEVLRIHWDFFRGGVRRKGP
jgi:hypothetical protein